MLECRFPLPHQTGMRRRLCALLGGSSRQLPGVGPRGSACQAWANVKKSGFTYARYNNAVLARSYQYGQGIWEFKGGLGEHGYSVINNG